MTTMLQCIRIIIIIIINIIHNELQHQKYSMHLKSHNAANMSWQWQWEWKSDWEWVGNGRKKGACPCTCTAGMPGWHRDCQPGNHRDSDSDSSSLFTSLSGANVIDAGNAFNIDMCITFLHRRRTR